MALSAGRVGVAPTEVDELGRIIAGGGGGGEGAEALENLGGLRFGYDEDGNYGYYKVGADTLTPFKVAGPTRSVDLIYQKFNIDRSEFPCVCVMADGKLIISKDSITINSSGRVDFVGYFMNTFSFGNPAKTGVGWFTPAELVDVILTDSRTSLDYNAGTYLTINTLGYYVTSNLVSKIEALGKFCKVFDD